MIEECLSCLQNQEWERLNKILSDKTNSEELAGNPIFKVFETHLMKEVKRYNLEGDPELYSLLSKFFQLHQDKFSHLTFSENCFKEICEYLFQEHPTEAVAEELKDNKDAIKFLKEKENQNKIISENIRIGANLNLNVGSGGQVKFLKEIFNSPQEKELYIAANNKLSNVILLPNAALSTIIDSKVCNFLDPDTKNFFFKSTLDLCVISKDTFMPTFFIELDSSWHDSEKSQRNDKRKDLIFERAGLTLTRIRKVKNKSMIEIFELFLKNHYPE